jgi:hypothetical protein
MRVKRAAKQHTASYLHPVVAAKQCMAIARAAIVVVKF